MPKRILVFPGATEIGLEIHRSLSSLKEIYLVGAGSIDSHGPMVFRHFVEIPHVSDPAWFDRLIEVCSMEGIDAIFPAYDEVIAQLSAKRALLPCRLLTSPGETGEICRSKRATYRLLAGSIATPLVFESTETITGYPVFAKPDRGQGSEGAHRVEDPATAQRLNFDTHVVSEYLPGPEYTVDCFTDRHGRLRYVSGRTRSRVKSGISMRSQSVQDDRFAEYASAINLRLSLRGAWFFQVKEDKQGKLVLLEVAPRVAGAMAVSRARAVNLPLLTVFDAFDYDVEISPNLDDVLVERALINRYQVKINYSAVYVDLDDTLIIRDQVNAQLVRFLYQAFNRGCKLHLITRHAGVPTETLQEFRLNGLFDSIIHIQDGSPKSNYLPAAGAIFIDDSYRERADVWTRLRIPTFDAITIEVLLNDKD